MKKIRSTLFNMIFVLSGISMLSAAVVTFVYIKTKPTIEENAKNGEISAIVELFGETFDNDPLAEKIIVPKKNGKNLLIYPLRSEGSIYALAINTYSNKGFGGDIYIMTGFYLDGEMAGYKVLGHKETPGLGSKIGEEKFKSQFNSLKITENTLNLRKNGGEIDGITSATISSKAVLDAIKKAKKAYDKFTHGAN